MTSLIRDSTMSKVLKAMTCPTPLLTPGAIRRLRASTSPVRTMGGTPLRENTGLIKTSPPILARTKRKISKYSNTLLSIPHHSHQRAAIMANSSTTNSFITLLIQDPRAKSTRAMTISLGTNVRVCS